MRSLVLALLALLLTGAPAGAAGTLTPYDTRWALDGPYFAGDRIAWATPTDDGAEIQLAAPDGSAHTTQPVGPDSPAIADHRFFGMAASDRRLAAGLHIGYYTSRKGGTFDVEYSRALTGPLGAPLQPVGGGCGDYAPPMDFAVDGDVVAEALCGGPVVVRDFGAGGEPVPHKLPAGRHVSLAGEYLAIAGDGVTLVRWRTGEVVLRIPLTFTQTLDVQEDGTVVFVPEFGYGRPRPVFVSSPAEPRVRTFDEGPAWGVQIARDRVAFSTLDEARVRALDGTVVAEGPGASVRDFDGERLTWARRPCAVLFIATWDLRDAAPAPPPGPCPGAALRSTTLRSAIHDFSQSVTVKLECPAEPALGCSGQMTLYARDSRKKAGLRGREVDMAWGSYALMPGERGTVTMPYQKNRVCIAGPNGKRPVLEIRSPSGIPGEDAPRVERHQVRVAGLDEAIERCSA